MRADDYLQHDATGLAALVRTGEAGAGDLLETAIELAEARNPAINALSQKLYDFGRKAIADGLPEGPFTGVPFLLKDASATLGGTVTANGARLLKDARAADDSHLVQRYRTAGLVIFGKTTTPEFSLAASTETSLTGATRNPWDTDRTAGGSSGGTAAAVAAGIVPAAHGSDGGGSIRIPASCCGLFGLKPTRARTPAGPLTGEGWGSLSVAHVLTRSVRDSAALLDATQGYAPGDPYCAPTRDRPYADEVGSAPGKLRIAWQRAPLSGVPVDPACAHAAEDTARLLASLGHKIEEVQPPGDWEELGHALWVLVASNVSRALHDIGAARGKRVKRKHVDPVTWTAVKFARTLDVEDYSRAVQAVHRQGYRMAEFHARHDAILSPTLAQEPPLLGVQRTDTDDLKAYRIAIARFSPFTQLFNLTGQPSMSVPLHWSDSGLPVGTMLSTAFGREDLLFRLAGQLERERPWFHRRPEAFA